MDADILWLFDLTSGAGIWSHDAAHSSILIHGDHLYLNTGTGVDNTHRHIRTPDAPSLVVLDKRTGRLWPASTNTSRRTSSTAPGRHPRWPDSKGAPLVFFAAGNGIVYAFEPLERGIGVADGKVRPLH